MSRLKITALRSALIAVLILLLFGAGVAEAAPGFSCGACHVPSSSNTVGDTELAGVATISASDIWAVGEYDAINGSAYPQLTLTEHWNGTQWSIVNSPNPVSGGGDASFLTGVAGVSTNDIWAVGYYYTNSGIPQRTLIEHWNGTQWSIVNSPNPSGEVNALSRVAVVSASDVWAVGYDNNSRGAQLTLIEHWNGTSWSVVSSPNPGGSQGGDTNSLTSVMAVSANGIWAAGYYNNGGYQQGTLVEHWNGTHWSVVSSPGSGFLFGGSIVSTSNVWAVGSHANSSNASLSLVEHWNGSNWSVVSSPNPAGSKSGSANNLSGVASVSTNDIWAVGYYYGNIYQEWESLIEHWNGTSWSVVSSPNPGEFYEPLLAVTSVSTNDVWAVGYDDPNNGPYRPLIKHWNGTNWSLVSSPLP